MEGIIDFILSNLFILIIIVGGLLNLFSSSKKEERKQERRRKILEERKRMQREMKEHRPLESQQTNSPVVEIEEEPYTESEHDKSKRADESVFTGDFEQQRQAQYERLREQIQASAMYDEDDEKEVRTKKNSKKIAPRRSQERAHSYLLHEQLDRQRLIDSIIMKEVLGPPRAYKKHHPYFRD